MAVGDITHVAIDGTLLSASLATIYTTPASRIIIAAEFLLCNVGTGNETYEIQMIESGGSAGDGKKVASLSASTNPILPGVDDGRSYNPMLEAADFVQMKASTANKISVRGGITLKEV